MENCLNIGTVIRYELDVSPTLSESGGRKIKGNECMIIHGY